MGEVLWKPRYQRLNAHQDQRHAAVEGRGLGPLVPGGRLFRRLFPLRLGFHARQFGRRHLRVVAMGLVSLFSGRNGTTLAEQPADAPETVQQLM